MKKLVVTVVSMLCFAPVVFADNWGLGLRVGAGENDPKDLKDLYDSAFDYGYTQKELDRNYGFAGVQVFYEKDLSEANKLGLKVDAEGYGENELKLDGNYEKLTETTYAFPITLYYKRDNGVKNWSFLAGAGVTVMRSKIEWKEVGWPTEKWAKTKVFPHITAGAEYRFTKLFALGMDVRYNFASKIKKEELVLSDRSGIGAAITGRFYF